MTTYTDKWSLALPDAGEVGWAELVNNNFIVISEHMGGRINELADFTMIDMPQNGDAIRYNASTELWENCRSTLVGIQRHQDLQGLGTDSHGIYLMLDGSKPMTANLNMGFFRGINAANPVDGSDIATKSYVDTTDSQMRQSEYVLERDINDPTTILQKAEGDAYIVGSEPVGEWSGKKNQIMIWMGGAWYQYTPLREGKLVYVIADHAFYEYNGTGWVELVKQLSHGDLLDLTLDTHPQYLNSSRHATASHVLGVTVPFGTLDTLTDVLIDDNTLANKHLLVFELEANAPLNTGRWKNVAATTIGVRKHDDLWDRYDNIDEIDPAIGATTSFRYCYDPTKSYYNKSQKSHPEYMSFPEHEFDDHQFLFDKYIPWSAVPGISADLPKGIRLGGSVYFKIAGSSTLTVNLATQTADHTQTHPNASGTIMVQPTAAPRKGQVVISDGNGTYESIPEGEDGRVFVSKGNGTAPVWATRAEVGIGVNADWEAESGPSMILHKPRQFITVGDTAPQSPVLNDIWIDTN